MASHSAAAPARRSAATGDAEPLDRVRVEDAGDDELALDPPVDDPSAGLRRLGLWLLVAGVVGFAAAFSLTVDRIKLLLDPSFVPSCNLNPIISCGSVMVRPQAAVFGFPNSIIGVGAFGVVAAVGAGLLAGARYRGWYWTGLLAGSAFGVGFVHWLAYQSMFRIGALCPWCMVVWTVTIPTFLAVASYTLRTGRLGHGAVPLGRFLRRHFAELLTVWYLVFVLTAGVQFWSYWKTLI